MTDASGERRNRIFAAVRGRLGVGAAAPGRAAAAAQRIASPPSHPVPQRARQDEAQLRTLFIEQLRAVSATVLTVDQAADVPTAIAAYLRGNNLPLEVRAGSDPWLAGLAWSREPALNVKAGRAEPGDEVGMTRALAGVAETGTLVMAAGPDNPVTVNFLPETSVIVIPADALVGPYEAAFDKVRARYGKGVMPRTLNLISGPSRTADVGGRLVTGAHGPRRLCVVLVG